MSLTKENVRKFLGWCSVINIGILIYWIIALTLGNNLYFRYILGGSISRMIALMKSITQ